jgi:phosphoglycolate phosphatase-like HAD superfamily hydrolase
MSALGTAVSSTTLSAARRHGHGASPAGVVSKPRVLLCDLDGTLIDSMPALTELAVEVMTERYGVPASLARELYLSTCGLPFVRQVELVFPGDRRNASASALFEAKKVGACASIAMSDEVHRTLERLRELGVKIVVSSNNGVENVAAFTRSSRFVFDMAMGFGAGMAKGQPHFARVAAAFDVARQDMLFVGDSLHDGELAEQGRVPFLGIATTFSPERFVLRFPQFPVVRRFAEIPDLFEDEAGLESESVAERGMVLGTS